MCRYEVEKILGDFEADVFPAETDGGSSGESEFSGKPCPIPYRYYVPKKAAGAAPSPVFLFMHGAGERGFDNGLQLRTALWNFAETNPEVKDFIIIAPQCPENTQWVYTDWSKVGYDIKSVRESWQIKTVLKILDSVTEKFGGDRDRTYVGGLSMGAFATWDLLSRHGELFAAGIAVCGGADVSCAAKLVDIPIRAFHGSVDPVVPVQGTRNICDAVKALGGKKLTYTEYEGVDHNSWDAAFSTEGLAKWLLSNRLSDRLSGSENSAE